MSLPHTDTERNRHPLLPLSPPSDRDHIIRWLALHRPGPQAANAGITPARILAAVTLAEWAAAILEDEEGRA